MNIWKCSINNYKKKKKERELADTTENPMASNKLVIGDGKEEKKQEIERVETHEEKKERLLYEAEEKKKQDEEEKKRKQQEKLDKLHDMCDNVVPGSAKLIRAEDDFMLYRLVIFKKGLKRVVKLMRQERFTVREFKYDPQDMELKRKQKQRLCEKRRTAWNAVVRWCKVWYERIFKMWIHVKALRCFVESILRYGLPPDFQSYLIEIHNKKKTQLRSSLNTLYASLGNESMNDQDIDTSKLPTGGALLGFTEDFYPYVSLDLKLDSS